MNASISSSFLAGSAPDSGSLTTPSTLLGPIANTPEISVGSATLLPTPYYSSAWELVTIPGGPSRPKPTLAEKAWAAAQLVYDGALISFLETNEVAAANENTESIEDVLTEDMQSLAQIVHDPDDPNYMVIVTPGAPEFITLPGIPSWTQQQLATWDDLINNIELSDPLVQAMTASLNRAQGAYDAGGNFWAAAQFANFEDYYQQDLTYATAIYADAGTLGLLSVPEPSTWAMMLIGFTGLGYAGFRRRPTVRM